MPAYGPLDIQDGLSTKKLRVSMRRIMLMLALVVAGELVFGLPFNVPRFFRPTMLDVFVLTNTELGDMFAVYGIAAMIAYFPGGAVADHFSARSLMVASLLATAAGGLYMATLPGAIGMRILYGYWGITTIFLFWGALIRATRDWGGENAQGAAFGILEGGRGLVAASAATFGVIVLANYLPDNVRLATVDERAAAFRTVVLLYTLVTALAGVFAWFAIPASKLASEVEFSPLRGMGIVIRCPIVWAQAAIILCAYCCYKGLDNYSLYAVQVLGMDQVEGARLASYGAWTRPVAAVLAGLIADRFNATRSIGVMFIMLGLCYGVWSLSAPTGSGTMIIYANFFATYIGVYALRGVYFALLEDSQTPRFLTGASVGMISLVGFAPDVFFGPISGRILDANPGIVGHQNYFLFLASITIVGLLFVAWLTFLHRFGGEKLWKLSEQTRNKSRQRWSITDMNQKSTLREQLRRNAVALISLTIALASLGYNTWRNEASEQNRNQRLVSIELLSMLGDLQQATLDCHYGESIDCPATLRRGWTKVLTIRDLSLVSSGSIPESADALFEIWRADSAHLGKADATEKRIIEALEAVRRDTHDVLVNLD